MARIARVVIPGYPHHVTQRGNRRQKVFFDPSDYRTYLDLVVEGCRQARAECWAYCLMPDHVHLVLVPESPDGLRRALAEPHRLYTREVNARQGWRGHLWQERFHSFPMDETYLLSCVRYVERSPVRAGLVSRPQEWQWSSARARLLSLDDPLVSPAPMLDHIDDWSAYLSTDSESRVQDALQCHALTGRPLGSERFLDTAEQVTGRLLRPQKPGRKPRGKKTSSEDVPRL